MPIRLTATNWNVTPDDDAVFVAKLPPEWRAPVAAEIARVREKLVPDHPIFVQNDDGLQYSALDASGEPFACARVHWLAWFETTDFSQSRLRGKMRRRWPGHPRSIGLSQVGGAMISTVFLPELKFRGEDIQLAWRFESRVFGGPLDDAQWRYQTRRDALEGHAILVKIARWARRNCPRKLKIAIARLGTGTEGRMARHWKRRALRFRRDVDAITTTFAAPPRGSSVQ